MICSKHKFSLLRPDIFIKLFLKIQYSVGGMLFSVYSRKHVRAPDDIKNKTINVRRRKKPDGNEKISLLNQIACNRF